MSLVDKTKSSYWLAANVKFDLPIQKILHTKPDIDWNELSSVTMHPTELDWHKKHNFTNGYDRIDPPLALRKIATALGFTETSSVWLNNQPPGAVMGRHVDSVSCFTYEQHDNFLDMKYDKQIRQPKEMKKIYPNSSIRKEIIGEIIGFNRVNDSKACEFVSSITGDNEREVVSFGTEAGLFQEIGISTVVCGPGSIEQAHKIDEFIELNEMKKCLKFLEGVKDKSVN